VQANSYAVDPQFPWGSHGGEEPDGCHGGADLVPLVASMAGKSWAPRWQPWQVVAGRSSSREGGGGAMEGWSWAQLEQRAWRSHGGLELKQRGRRSLVRWRANSKPSKISSLSFLPFKGCVNSLLFFLFVEKKLTLK